MNVQQLLATGNRFEKEEVELASTLSFKAFKVEEGISKKSCEDRIALLEDYTQFLLKFLRSEFVETNEQHTGLMNLISNLKIQKEILEILSGKVKLSDLMATAERFGKKTQFSSPQLLPVNG